MARNTDEYCFMECEDGIYFGRPLKNGSISSDSRKVEDTEIVTLFEKYLRRYCIRNVTNVMEVERDGKTVIEAKLFVR